ncbi:MAG: RNA 2',3'-cyclic phosphodiesterase, partial [Aquificota bacterium]
AKFVNSSKFIQKIKKYENTVFAHINKLEVNIIESHLTYKGAIYRKID